MNCYMPRFLPDTDIQKLLGDVIHNGDESLINPNGIELRLGSQARFISTGEIKEIPEEYFLKIPPGETVIIVSLESIDFSRETVAKHFRGCGIMGLITPTTTMMREGANLASTKVDDGFVGHLNWGIRNGSYKDLIIQRGEPIFKLTLVVLEGGEVPSLSYGERAGDKYQRSDGIRMSARRLPADIPNSRLVSSSAEKLDPKTHLREAGYPFTHIGSELVRLDGKFELVSADVRALTEKMETDTRTVLSKIDDLKTWLLDHVDTQFSRKFGVISGTLVTAGSLMVAAYAVTQKLNLGAALTAGAFGLIGVVALAVTWALASRRRS